MSRRPVVAESAIDPWRATAVLHRYCRAIDSSDEPALRDVFAADAVMILSGSEGAAPGMSLSGRDQIVPALASLFPGRAWARHFISNELVESRPDGSVALRCYFRFVLAQHAGTEEGMGDYDARLVEMDGRLVISSLTVSILERGVRPIT
jgi:hypothetical protein